jgi:hypothetical protein
LRQRFVLGVLAVGEQPCGALGQPLPGISQRQPSRGTVEQPRAQPLLQPADRLETVALDSASSVAAAANDRNSTTFAKIASASKSGSFAMRAGPKFILGNNVFQ